VASGAGSGYRVGAGEAETIMRRSAGLLIPITIIIAYYVFWVCLTWLAMRQFPGLAEYFPIGGISELAEGGYDTFEPVYSRAERTILAPSGPIKLFFAIIGSVIAVVPVSWVYFITSRARKLDQSFLQTIVILPIVVTGIAMIVINSIALAFSLAGVVAAVRFRFSLALPSDAMYIFVAIGIGLGCGIGAVAISVVISFAFVIATLTIWKLEYGKSMSGSFLTMLTRRNLEEDEY
jgi:hypothetical protein